MKELYIKRMTTQTITSLAEQVLCTNDADAKAKLGREIAVAWRSGEVGVGDTIEIERPGRPGRPELLPPRMVKKRKITAAPRGRIALLHALAHIELNAVDLSWDAIARFSPSMPRAYTDDWVKVADEESKHFLLISDRLRELGSFYGELPAHDGLWQAATETRHDVRARMAVVPLVLEARGLDVTPPMIEQMRNVGDEDSAAILQIIHDDEIGHVAIGKRWFDHCCEQDGAEKVETWQHLVRTYFRGPLKPPFNVAAREAAGFSSAYYGPLAEERQS